MSVAIITEKITSYNLLHQLLHLFTQYYHFKPYEGMVIWSFILGLILTQTYFGTCMVILMSTFLNDHSQEYQMCTTLVSRVPRNQDLCNPCTFLINGLEKCISLQNLNKRPFPLSEQGGNSLISLYISSKD